MIACEESGRVRDAFIAAGHDAISCDLQETSIRGPHLKGDIRDVDLSIFDLLIAHPECKYLTATGNRWFLLKYRARFPDREWKRIEAINFFLWLANAPVKRICIENPVGIMSTAWMPPTQYIQPWQFGDNAQKKTGLWLKNLPALIPTNIVDPDMIQSKKGVFHNKWHYETINLPKAERSKARSTTFPGIAAAMAAQWGCLEN